MRPMMRALRRPRAIGVEKQLLVIHAIHAAANGHQKGDKIYSRIISNDTTTTTTDVPTATVIRVNASINTNAHPTAVRVVIAKLWS